MFVQCVNDYNSVHISVNNSTSVFKYNSVQITDIHSVYNYASVRCVNNQSSVREAIL